jgi:probable F420-dependent oxidoreductase
VKVAYGYPLLSAPPAPELVDGEAIAAVAQAAEAAGFAALALTEHPAPLEAWRRSGGHDAVDPFVGLAFAAAATTRLRLLTYLVVLPYRNPLLFAKSVASLDALSRGRLELGLGAGYQRAEFRALGVDFEERNALFDEALEVAKLAWAGEPFTYAGRHFSAKDTALLPRPSQRPHPLLWFGGNSTLTRRRVVAHGAGWMPVPNARATAHVLRSPALETLDDLSELLGDVQRRAAEAGKPPVERVMYFLANLEAGEGFDKHLELARRAQDRGVSWVFVNGQGRTPAEAKEWIDRYADAVLTRL